MPVFISKISFLLAIDLRRAVPILALRVGVLSCLGFALTILRFGQFGHSISKSIHLSSFLQYPIETGTFSTTSILTKPPEKMQAFQKRKALRSLLIFDPFEDNDPTLPTFKGLKLTPPITAPPSVPINKKGMSLKGHYSLLAKGAPPNTCFFSH